MDQRELNEILEKHKMWLNGEEGGIRADLRNANLFNVDLNGADLNGADLNGADLYGADLRYADLHGANLRCADLHGADLHGANLRIVNLCDANLCDANLCHASLHNADLHGANLCCANLRDANLDNANLCHASLHNADLRDVKYNERTAFFEIQCPEEGAFIGYKKANSRIVKLEICEDSKRSSATTRKCRCSAAKVISITNLNGSPSGLVEVTSDYDPNFVYKVGEIVSVSDFNDDRWIECSTGIHFFITRQEAVNYC